MKSRHLKQTMTGCVLETAKIQQQLGLQRCPLFVPSKLIQNALQRVTIKTAQSKCQHALMRIFTAYLRRGSFRRQQWQNLSCSNTLRGHKNPSEEK